MRAVFKYEVPIRDVVTIRMPANAKVLHVATQHGFPFLWALVDTDAPIVRRRFRVAGTGHPIEGALTHVGSLLLEVDALVFHVFEIE